jgi:hypothetical protein
MKDVGCVIIFQEMCIITLKNQLGLALGYATMLTGLVSLEK